MARTTVMRVYSFSIVVVLVVVSFVSFSRPVKSARPQAQEQLYVHIPTALDPKGKPPVAAPAKSPGSALAYISIPRFGKNWLWTVVEGTSDEDLADGPGHYTGTPLMGARGNFAIAGHRAGHGDPFIDFDKLEVGDTVTFRQNGAWWRYQITKGPRIIGPNDTWVLDQPAYGRHFTLTTCWPRYGDAKRMFVSGVLVSWSGK